MKTTKNPDQAVEEFRKFKDEPSTMNGKYQIVKGEADSFSGYMKAGRGFVVYLPNQFGESLHMQKVRFKLLKNGEE